MDMSKSEMAQELYNGGFNCAASVLASFCEDYELDTELAMKLACGLGGGCAEGEICGAASAAVIVVGLKYGQCIQDDRGAKMNCHARTTQFLNEFRQKHGALTCRDLLADISQVPTPAGDGKEDVKERRRFCAGLVTSAVEILEELGY